MTIGAYKDSAQPPATVGALEAVLELARSASEDPLAAVLEAVAEAVLRIAGFRAVVFNLYRREHGDFRIELVWGEARRMSSLVGNTFPGNFLSELPVTPVQPRPDVYFVEGAPALWDNHRDSMYVLPLPRSDDPLLWDPADLLMVILRDTDGTPIGLISVDDPESGERPGPEQLQLLDLICSFAEQALRSARRSREGEDDRRMLTTLGEVSPRVSACTGLDELYDLVADTIVPGLGFDRLAIYLAVKGDKLSLRRRRGWPPRTSALPRTLDREHVRGLVGSAPEVDDWRVVEASALFGAAGAQPRSARNGHGPVAWSDHCVLLPWTRADGALIGLVVVEDPCNRLIPREQQLRAVRLLVDLAASVQHMIGQRMRLNRLARHDTLTGLYNRRGLHQLIAQQPDAAVLFLDLDAFKQVNDVHGHEAGDLVLARFGALLDERISAPDMAIRLGGDEFCVVLAESGRERALAVAEEIRSATTRELSELVSARITTSIGIALRAEGRPLPRALLTRADAALYRAKHGGRDRIELSTRPTNDGAINV